MSFRSPSLCNSSNLLKVSLWRNLLGYLIPLCGPTITVFVRLGQPQNIYTNKLRSLQISNCGIGYGSSTVLKKIQIFIWKAMRNRVPTRQYLAFSCPNVNVIYPRCNSPETTIHILIDCPWAKDVWGNSPGILPLSFFQTSLQPWL